MKHVPYWGATNIRRHRARFCRHGDLATGHCEPLHRRYGAVTFPPDGGQRRAESNTEMFIVQYAEVIGVAIALYEGVLISPSPDQEGNKRQRQNSGFIQHTPHEAQYTS